MNNWEVAGTWDDKQLVCYLVNISDPSMLYGATWPLYGRCGTIYVLKGE